MAGELTVTRIEKLCVDKGLRMTEQRRVIARVLSDAADHPDAEELYRRASRSTRTSPSPPSIAR
jgi:Fe2+ or Zn2+ uptake regulation protein